MINRLTSLTRGKKSTQKEEVREEGGYVRRGSEYQQYSDWHHDASSMMGTKTNNFSNGDDDSSPKTPPPQISPKGRKSKEELEWNNLRKNHVDAIKKNQEDETAAAASSPPTSARTVRRNSLLGHSSANLMSMWGTRRVPTVSSEPNQPCIVELRRAANLPVMGSDSDGGTNPFVTMKIVPGPTAKGRLKGEMRRWPYKTNTSRPIWNKTRDLGRFKEGDSLVIEVHHHGKGASHSARPTFLTGNTKAPVFSQLIGGANFVLQNVEVGREYSIVVKTVTKGRKVEGSNPNLPVILTLRLLPPPEAKKTVFIIRHAESKWNRAQRRHDLAGLANVDHGLSQAGRVQAELLWRRLELEACLADLIKQEMKEDGQPAWFRAIPLRACDLAEDEKTTKQVAMRSDEEHKNAAADIAKLWSAEQIWVSPLTRTIQTALIALQGHPTLRNKGFTLAADAREIKGIGGLDSIGVAKGEAGIRSRVEGEFLDLYSHKSALSDDPLFTPNRIVESLLSPHLDAGDASDEWWTSAFNSDKTEDVDVRLNELLNSIKFAQTSSLVLVSHSNLFRALLGRRLANTLRQRSPALCKDAAENKMKNCALVRLEIDFSLDISQCITELIPIFCDETGVFEASKEKKEKSGGMSRSRHSSSPPRSSAPASSFAAPPGVTRPNRSAQSMREPGKGLMLKTTSLREPSQPLSPLTQTNETWKSSSSSSPSPSQAITNLAFQTSPLGEGLNGQKPAGQFTRASSPVMPQPTQVDVVFPSSPTSPTSPKILLPGLFENDKDYEEDDEEISASVAHNIPAPISKVSRVSDGDDDGSMGFGSIYGGHDNMKSPKVSDSSDIGTGNSEFSGDNPFSRLSINSNDNPLQRRVSNQYSEKDNSNR